jgi:DNA-binding transcriptional regulator YhcF (GntR family)
MSRVQQEPISLSLRRNSSTGLVEQVAASLSLMIEQGKIRPGARLPSVRQFALDQGVSITTIVEAYERLVAKGVMAARRGAGFSVEKDGRKVPSGPLFSLTR